MAKVVKVRRRVNPKRKRNAARSLSAKQIRYFGTPQQKAALKRKRRAAAKPQKRTARPKTAKRRVRRQANPALVLTLGAVNPRRQKVAVKKRKKVRKINAHRSRKANPTRVYVMAPRKQNRRRVTRKRNPVSRHRRRSNPNLFGHNVSTGQMGKAVAGGLVGVAAAKFIPTMLPAGLVSSNIMRVIATGVSAFVAGWAAGKADKTFGDAVLFGGLMQTGSVALNAFVPSIGKQVGLSGLTPARFPLPDNPILAGMIPTGPAVAANVGSLAAFRSAF
jgi:hypothetical protein